MKERIKKFAEKHGDKIAYVMTAGGISMVAIGAYKLGDVYHADVLYTDDKVSRILLHKRIGLVTVLDNTNKS